MSTLTPEGQRTVDNLAQRHNFSADAVAHMLTAIIAGQGRMAQFAHAEFGGNGQWMSGGMLMLGDMFNTGLKNRVDALCSDLSTALASSGPLAGPVQSQSQSQNQGVNGSMHLPDTPFLTPSTQQSWWPQALGTPSSSGSQNSMRYAWFADARRLVIDNNGKITTYDTGNLNIGGFSQQQGGHEGLSMSSQFGTIDLATLPVVSDPDVSDQVAADDGHQRTDASHEVVSDSPEIDEQSFQESQSRGTESHELENQEARNRQAVHAFQEPSPLEPQRESPEQSQRKGGYSGNLGDNDRSTTPIKVATDDRDDPLTLIERMGELRDRGLLTEEEFSTKKIELLSRL